MQNEYEVLGVPEYRLQVPGSTPASPSDTIRLHPVHGRRDARHDFFAIEIGHRDMLHLYVHLSSDTKKHVTNPHFRFVNSLVLR